MRFALFKIVPHQGWWQQGQPGNQQQHQNPLWNLSGAAIDRDTRPADLNNVAEGFRHLESKK
jgi:hypothetical protein